MFFFTGSFLLLPDAGRLFNFFVLNRSVASAPETALVDGGLETLLPWSRN